MDIQRISDELKIASVLNRYARAEVSDWLERGLALLPMTQHYITNVETEIDGDTATVRAMFYNPMLLPGATEISACGGYYHHVLVRTESGWRSKQLREENLWFDNPPSGDLRDSLQDEADRA